MNLPHSAALVFFGATGDIIFKKVHPRASDTILTMIPIRFDNKGIRTYLIGCLGQPGE